jgi:hypothetical protein
MKIRISALIAAAGLSAASMSAHAAVNAFLTIDDAAATPVTMSGAIDFCRSLSARAKPQS